MRNNDKKSDVKSLFEKNGNEKNSGKKERKSIGKSYKKRKIKCSPDRTGEEKSKGKQRQFCDDSREKKYKDLTPSNQEELNEKIRKKIRMCMEQHNQYIELEPQRNQAYQEAFRSEKGIITHMERYVQEIEEELAAADEVDWMQQIVWGNYLQFLYSALIGLHNTIDRKREDKKMTEESQYEEYIGLIEKDFRNNPIRLEELQNKNNHMLMAEKRKRDKRELYEKLEKDLNELELIPCLKNPEGWLNLDNESDIDRANRYEEKALELKVIFAKLLNDTNVQMDEINGKDYSEWIEKVGSPLV